MKKSQKAKILAYLQKGKTLTPYQALKMFNCFRLGGRINDLRNEGHKIATTMIKNKYGNSFAKYKLES